MAIKSTIFKANLQIADIDHNYYADHSLTLARHPSETDQRMMVRLVKGAYWDTEVKRAQERGADDYPMPPRLAHCIDLGMESVFRIAQIKLKLFFGALLKFRQLEAQHKDSEVHSL